MRVRRNHKKILIIGGEPSLVYSLEWFLDSRGYSAIAILDYCEAMAAVNCIKNGMDRFNAVVIEAGNPVIDDLKLIRELKTVHCAMPVIVLASASAEQLAVRYLDFGADGLMNIPFSPPELEARVNSLIRRACMSGRP
ncbi:MAG TPA: response regulator [Candidatus Wallbacteria bacterium]|nr:response regulator [Candidatus Wallbacteria bacterium]